MVVTGTYNPHLVALSILVAAFASYTALDLGGRAAATRGVAPRVWPVAAAIAMGGGIWSMHFIAMLAFNIPIPMSYDIGLTTLSLVVAIFVTGAGFYFINRQSAPPLFLVFSGIFMGLGIAAMHYIGMAAMREHAEISYDFLFVALSLVIAIGGWPAASWAWPFPVCTTRRCEGPLLPFTARFTRPMDTQVSIKPIWLWWLPALRLSFWPSR